MARSTKDVPDPLMIGYVPAPPGAMDPLDAPGKASAKPTSPPPDVADEEEGAPFEDELAAPQVPKTALTQPPMESREATPPLRLEDPRELARRLADEARQKAAARSTPAPAPAAAAPPPAKSKLSDRAPAPSAPAPAPAATPAPAPMAAAPAPQQAAAPPKRSLMERAARPVSAQDALKAAQEASVREAAVAKAKKKTAKDAARAAVAQAAAAPQPVRAAPAPAPAPVAAAPAAAVAPIVDFATLLGKNLPGAALEREIVVTNGAIFRALWMAHRARALATRDLGLLFTANVMLDAADRVPAGCLVAAQVSLGDRSVAMWADTSRAALLGYAESPEIYLAGL